MSFATELAAQVERVEARLPSLLPDPGAPPSAVHEAMRYAAIGSGKRLRPVVTMLVADLLGARARDRETILDLACAVELVHASSLILDDLPSMDDAAMRRGRPCTHKVFGEATALLASFALLNRAFQLVAETAERLRLSRYTPADLTHHLASAVGSEGLIGGQALDLAGTGAASVDLAELERIHSRKTGALFALAAELGAMAADARRRELEMIASYAKNLGLAYQIVDDLLDVEGDEAEAGKALGRDAAKVTFVRLIGVEGSKALAAELLEAAVRSLEPLGRKREPLVVLAEYVLRRRR
jgi:geranylgeranyl pyrophosphate synthase